MFIHNYNILFLIIIKDKGPKSKLVKTNSAVDFLKYNTPSASTLEGTIFDRSKPRCFNYYLNFFQGLSQSFSFGWFFPFLEPFQAGLTRDRWWEGLHTNHNTTTTRGSHQTPVTHPQTTTGCYSSYLLSSTFSDFSFFSELSDL